MLSVLYAAIAAELLAINAFVVPLVGEEHVASNVAPPKMIFIPSDDTFGPAEGPGGNPRPIYTIMAATELVLQARNTDLVEGMRDQFVIALRRAMKHASMATSRAGRCGLTKGKWTRGTIKMRNGLEYRLTFAVAFPIVDRAWPTPAPPVDDPGGTPVPQPPDATTYTGDQANTYPVIPAEELSAGITVGPTAAEPSDLVTITIAADTP